VAGSSRAVATATIGHMITRIDFAQRADARQGIRAAPEAFDPRAYS